ncbi:tol-pal system protein YbgF [Desulfospira joergensenii]|uniref:tol-pal system protein YbgF n=1 Tax=Desulfospira joergensenii TaxID=53329 RepID=UPI001376B165|nr:tol-pal system protein YbgF [Desulfospira joergensenii]
MDADLELARLTRALEKAEQEKGIKDKTISELEEKIHGLELKVRDLEKLIAQKKPAVIQLEYIEPVQLYQKARNLLLEGDAVNAAQLFQSFADHHPNHSLADNALYWLGECYYSLGRYTKAVEEFKNLVKTYPKAEKVPDALLKIGYSFLSMDDINRAGHFLKQVLKKYPFSPAAEKAEIKLKSIE